MKKLLISLFIIFLSIDSLFAIWNLEKEKEEVESFTSLILWFITPSLILKVFFAIFIVIFTIILSKFVKLRLMSYLERIFISQEWWTREEIIGVIARSINITILLVWTTITLSILWIDLGIFIGWIWFWIWFTLKSFLTNFISWVTMVTQGDYHIWDVVNVWWKTWKIRKINTLFTSIEQFDWLIFNVPNIIFMEEIVTNYHTNDKRRVDVFVWVDYKTDIVKAKSLMLEVIESFPFVLKAPTAKIFVEEFWDNSIKISLRFWINSRDKYFQIKSNVTETINHVFRENWIKIPFPQIEYTIKDGRDDILSNFKKDDMSIN